MGKLWTDLSAVNVHMKVLDGWANVLPAKNGHFIERPMKRLFPGRQRP